MHLKICLLSLVIFSFFLSVSAQGLTEIRYGQIPQSDIAMTSLPADRSAEAIVLHDGINLTITESTTGYELSQLIHRRVKIFKESAFDRANVKLYYYRGSESIRDLKALIVLPSGQKIELGSRDFIRENQTDDLSTIRFTFPQLVEGAILEYRYRRTSENVTQLPRYYFQEDIPVRFAEFKANLNAKLSYLTLSNAFEMMCINEEEHQKGNLSDNSYGNDAGVVSIRYHYAMCDIPAFQTEPYINNLLDYVPNVQFQLAEYYIPGRGWNRMLGTWESAAQQLMEEPDIGMRFKRNSQFRLIHEEVGPLMGENQLEKAQYALNRVNNHMNWDGTYRISSEVSLKDAWKATLGNSATLNMILLGLLRANDIEAEPLLVGFRDSGRPIQQFPVIRQFSHMMVLAQLDGEPTIIDANGSSGMVGLPRVQALNGAAWVMSTSDPRWIPIETSMMPQIHQAQVELASDGSADIVTQSVCRGYYRFAAESDLANEESEPEGPILDYLLNKYPGTVFQSRQITPPEIATDPVQIELQTSATIAESVGDYLYLRPVLMNFLENELIETEERQFPIDFAFPWRKVLVAEIQLPEGYVLEEKPEDRRLRSPDGGIRTHLYLQHKPEENTLAINFSVRVGKSVFGPQEYEILREVFEQVIDMQETVVVLRRE